MGLSEDSYMVQAEEPARDVRSIIAKYQGQYQLNQGDQTSKFGVGA